MDRRRGAEPLSVTSAISRPQIQTRGRKSVWKIVFILYDCADAIGVTTFLEKNEHFLFTYQCWLAILLHTFRNFSSHLPNNLICQDKQ